MMYNSFNEVKKMENGVLLQGFHWYIKPEEKLWKQLQEKVKSYKEMVMTYNYLFFFSKDVKTMKYLYLNYS